MHTGKCEKTHVQDLADYLQQRKINCKNSDAKKIAHKNAPYYYVPASAVLLLSCKARAALKYTTRQFLRISPVACLIRRSALQILWIFFFFVLHFSQYLAIDYCSPQRFRRPSTPPMSLRNFANFLPSLLLFSFSLSPSVLPTLPQQVMQPSIFSFHPLHNPRTQMHMCVFVKILHNNMYVCNEYMRCNSVPSNKQVPSAMGSIENSHTYTCIYNTCIHMLTHIYLHIFTYTYSHNRSY